MANLFNMISDVGKIVTSLSNASSIIEGANQLLISKFSELVRQSIHPGPVTAAKPVTPGTPVQITSSPQEVTGVMGIAGGGNGGGNESSEVDWYKMHGRGPGKQPPVDIIVAWTESKFGSPRLSYVIGRKIGKYGTAKWRGKQSGGGLTPEAEKLTEIMDTLGPFWRRNLKL